MTDPLPEAPDTRPPLGSWARLYALVLGLAVLLLVALYWFTARYQMPLEPP